MRILSPTAADTSEAALPDSVANHAAFRGADCGGWDQSAGDLPFMRGITVSGSSFYGSTGDGSQAARVSASGDLVSGSNYRSSGNAVQVRASPQSPTDEYTSYGGSSLLTT